MCASFLACPLVPVEPALLGPQPSASLRLSVGLGLAFPIPSSPPPCVTGLGALPEGRADLWPQQMYGDCLGTNKGIGGVVGLGALMQACVWADLCRVPWSANPALDMCCVPGPGRAEGPAGSRVCWL